jgi:uncharacterized iron-regulated protein
MMLGRVLAVLALAAACSGCAAVRPAAGAAEPDPRGVLVFSGEDGVFIGWDELVSAAAERDVVIVGENHGHALGLAAAAALWEDVLAFADDAALSLEFFGRDDQSRLDDYLAGLNDEAAFRRRTGRVAGNYPAQHHQMVEAAKAAGRPVHASNAPRTAVRVASRSGFEALEGLTAEQRRLFRVPDALPEGRYRDEFEDLMRDSFAAAHGVEVEDPEAQERMVQGMLRAQSLWDWTMAESIARALEAGQRPVVHIVGRFHSDFGGGLVQALERLSPGARVMTISMVPMWSDSLREEDAGRATVVVYVGPGAN